MIVETPEEVKARELAALHKQVEELFDNLGNVKNVWENDFIQDMVDLSDKIMKGKAKEYSEKQTEHIRKLHKKHVDKDE